MLHFLILDGNDEEWWLALGRGTTDNMEEAYRYPASALRRNGTTYDILNEDGEVENSVPAHWLVLAPELIETAIQLDKMVSLLDGPSRQMLRDATVKLDKAEDKLTELEKAGKLLLTPTEAAKITADLLKDLTYVGGKKPASEGVFVPPLRDDMDFLKALGIDPDPEPDPEPEKPATEVTVIESGQRLTHHTADVCFPEPCPLHFVTNHPLKLAGRRWMKAKMWRDCVHGVSHPDPDDKKVREIPHERLHTCCAEKCCGLD